MEKMNNAQYNEMYSILKLQKDKLYVIGAKVMQSVYCGGNDISVEAFMENNSCEFHALFYSFSVKLMDTAVRIDKAITFLKEAKYYQLKHVLAEAVFIADVLVESLKDDKVILGRGMNAARDLEKLSASLTIAIRYIIMNGEGI